MKDFSKDWWAQLTELPQQGVDRIDLKWNLLLCQWLDDDPAVPVAGEENPSLPVLSEGILAVTADLARTLDLMPSITISL